MHVHIRLVGDTSFHPEVIDKEAARVIDVVLERVRQNVARHAPKRTGRLARSFYVTRMGRNAGRVTSDLVYAAIQETGGTIYPKNFTFLRFQGSGGEWVYTRGPVTIPATHYFTKGVMETQASIGELLMESGGKIATGMGFYGI